MWQSALKKQIYEAKILLESQSLTLVFNMSVKSSDFFVFLCLFTKNSDSLSTNRTFGIRYIKKTRQKYKKKNLKTK